MKTLYIASSFRHTGKHLLSLGIMKELMRKRKKIGFFSPVGLMPIKKGKGFIDQDTEFLRKILGIKEPSRLVCPVVLDSKLMRQAATGKAQKNLEKIEKAYVKLSRGKDIMVVLGFGNIWSGTCIGVDQISLIRKMNARVLLVCPGDIEIYDTVDHLVPVKKAIGKNLIGVVFNRIPKARFESFRHEIAVPLKKRYGIETLGLIRMDDQLGSITVSRLFSLLNAKIICGRDHLDKPVERFAIGAMNLESATRYFRQIRNKAVITGGDRSDIQLAAIETNTKCLILTGKNLHPAPIIVSRADELGIPIAEVATDTFTVVDAVEHLFGHTALRDDVKAKRAVEIVKKNVNFKRIFSNLGL